MIMTDNSMNKDNDNIKKYYYDVVWCSIDVFIKILWHIIYESKYDKTSIDQAWSFNFFFFRDLSLSERWSIIDVIKNNVDFNDTFENFILNMIECLNRHCTEKTVHFNKVAARFSLIRYYYLTNVNVYNSKTILPYTYYFNKDHRWLKNIIDRAVSFRWIKPYIYDFEHLCDFIIEHLQPHLDMLFSFSSLSIFFKWYSLKIKIDHKSYQELPQETFMLIAIFASLEEAKSKRNYYAYKFYDIISHLKLSLASPIITNFRTFKSPTSCFIMQMGDNLESITDCVYKTAYISKNGGGVGVDLSQIRPSKSLIQNVEKTSSGPLPFIKMLNSTILAFDQLGWWDGALTAALPVWHYNIEDFLHIQLEGGELWMKSFDIFPQVIIYDNFMNYVAQDRSWYLFDSYELKWKYNVDFNGLYGEKFTKCYDKLVNEIIAGTSKLSNYKIVSSKKLFVRILKTQIETGLPYLFFIDEVNRCNPNKHVGWINAGNLCQESFSNFRNSKYVDNIVSIHKGTIAPRYYNWKFILGEIHSCNISSLNLSYIAQHPAELQSIIQLSVRFLDNVVSSTFWKPYAILPEALNHNYNYWTIGLGSIGLHDYLAFNDKKYSVQYKDDIWRLFEDIGFFTIEASNQIAKEKGSYISFEGSDWSKGIFFGKDIDWFKKYTYRPNWWLNLINDVKLNGLRNGQLLAIAPNTSTSIFQNATNSVWPIFKWFFIDKAKHSWIVFPKFLKSKKEFYNPIFTINPKDIIEIISNIQLFIDQGISLELFFNLNDSNFDAKFMYDTIFLAWKKKLKSLYYIRFLQKDFNVSKIKKGCESCMN